MVRFSNIKELAKFEKSYYDYPGFCGLTCQGCCKRLNVLNDFDENKMWHCPLCGFYSLRIIKLPLWKQPDYGFKSSEIYEAHQLAVGGEEF